MTNIEIYDYIMDKLDKSDSPYFTPEQVSRVFNESYLEWIENTANSFELTEKRRKDLIELTRIRNYGNSKLLDLTVFNSDILRVMAVHGDYSYDCKGQVNTYTRPIKPITWDSFATFGEDPYNQPNDHFPGYVEYSDSNGKPYIRIESTSTPSNVQVVYIKQPVKMDAENSPNASIEIKDTQTLEVIDICLSKLKLNIEDFNSVQALNSIEIPKNE